MGNLKSYLCLYVISHKVDWPNLTLSYLEGYAIHPEFKMKPKGLNSQSSQEV